LTSEPIHTIIIFVKDKIMTINRKLHFGFSFYFWTYKYPEGWRFPV